MLDTLNINVDLREDTSFFKESVIICPCCEEEIRQEELKTGGGRLDAGSLSVDLHRNYIIPQDHGAVFPFLYLVLTCHNCYLSMLKFDFSNRLKKSTLEKIASQEARIKRKKVLQDFYDTPPDFTQRKNLTSGLAAYLLAIASYDDFTSGDSPHIRMGVCALRSAWLCRHIIDGLEDGDEKDTMGMLEKIMYRKTFFFYDKALELSDNSSENREDLNSINYIGPDFDREYGFDGIIYMHAWLFLNHSRNQGAAHREAKLKQLKTNLSKIFGFGKASKEKPSALLDTARETYEEIDKELRIFGI